MTTEHLTREEIAKIELGRTDVQPAVARGLIAVFLGMIVLVPLVQATREFPLRRPTSEAARGLPLFPEVVKLLPAPSRIAAVRSTRDIIALVPSERAVRRFETALDDDSVVTHALTPWVGLALKGALRGSEEQAYFGRDGWLFYRPATDHVMSAGFLDPAWQRARLTGGDKWLPPPQSDPVKALVRFHEQLQPTTL